MLYLKEELDLQDIFRILNHKLKNNKMKRILKRILFGKPLLMSVFEDKHGNKYGGTIHKNDGQSYIDHTGHIEEPKFLGKVEIY